jgi:hypothetical protein
VEGNKTDLDNPSAVVSKWQMQETSIIAKKMFWVCQGIIAVATVIKTHSGVCCLYSLYLSCETTMFVF